MDRRLPLGAGFGEDDRAVWKIECREANLAWNGRPAVTPTQPPGNHQVNDDEDFVGHDEDDAFAHPPEAEHLPARQLFRPWRDRPHNERVANPQALERLPRHPPGEGLEIEGDVWQFWHSQMRVAELGLGARGSEFGRSVVR